MRDAALAVLRRSFQERKNMGNCTKCGADSYSFKPAKATKLAVGAKTILLFYSLWIIPFLLTVIPWIIFQFHMHGFWIWAGIILGACSGILLGVGVNNEKATILGAIQSYITGEQKKEEGEDDTT